jgi:hypothetical protein
LLGVEHRRLVTGGAIARWFRVRDPYSAFHRDDPPSPRPTAARRQHRLAATLATPHARCWHCVEGGSFLPFLLGGQSAFVARNSVCSAVAVIELSPIIDFSWEILAPEIAGSVSH